jgi:hypothetical protein
MNPHVMTVLLRVHLHSANQVFYQLQRGQALRISGTQAGNAQVIYIKG